MNANLSFNATCLSEYSGAPKFGVGEQQWKALVNDSELSCYYQNDSYNTIPRKLYVWGDIRPSAAKPKYHYESGGSNFTQEGTIAFLGSSVDDCGDSLTLNISNVSKEVIFYALHPEADANTYVCNITTELIGGNAYSCDLPTSLNTQKGWYNVSFAANKSYYYPNTTFKTGDPGVFYMGSLKRLVTPIIAPTTEGWGKRNWNFSIIASSGDPDIVYNLSLLMGQTPPPSASCEPPECSNETTRDILSDISVTRYWYRNFTSNQQGTWYYRFQMKYENDETLSAFDAGTHKVTVEEDDVNITYTAGNNSGVIKDTQPQRLIAQVYDRDALTYNLTPNATVTFKVRRVGFGIYTNGEKTIGTNTTNSSGHAEYNWNVTDCAWYEGAQNWSAEITDSEPNYKANYTENLTISVTLTGCTASLDATQILLPRETFQYRNFTINATVASIGGTADDVYATLMNIPSGWTVDTETKSLGSISTGSVMAVSWVVNATSYGEYNVTVFASSSNAGNKNISSNNFTVYKE
ncbi:hypothetical protein J4444_05165, partial [Candidatus Woesearchaeota archaeon]|nr:hypothetical protein [Candidatus Woesearchaeota archaeon]